MIIAKNTTKTKPYRRAAVLFFHTVHGKTLRRSEHARVSLQSGACFCVALMSGVGGGCSVETGRSVVAAPVGCLIERARDKVLGQGRSKSKVGLLEERLGWRLARGRPSTSRSDELCPRTLVGVTHLPLSAHAEESRASLALEHGSAQLGDEGVDAGGRQEPLAAHGVEGPLVLLLPALVVLLLAPHRVEGALRRRLHGLFVFRLGAAVRVAPGHLLFNKDVAQLRMLSLASTAARLGALIRRAFC